MNKTLYKQIYSKLRLQQEGLMSALRKKDEQMLIYFGELNKLYDNLLERIYNEMIINELVQKATNLNYIRIRKINKH